MAGFVISTPLPFTVTSLIKVLYFLKSAFCVKMSTDGIHTS